MRQFSIMILTLVLLLLFASTALATNAVTVFVEDQVVASDVQPILENGRIFLPVRTIFEKLGASVEWNEDTQTVTATKDNTIIQITIDQDTAYKNS